MRDIRFHRREVHRRLPADEVQTDLYGGQGTSGHRRSVRRCGRGDRALPRHADGPLRELRHLHRAARPRGGVHGHLRAGGGDLEGASGVRYRRAERVRHLKGQATSSGIL